MLFHSQEDAVQEALSGAHALILQAEALRLTVVGTGVHHCTVSAWLLTVVRYCFQANSFHLEESAAIESCGLCRMMLYRKHCQARMP